MCVRSVVPWPNKSQAKESELEDGLNNTTKLRRVGCGLGRPRNVKDGRNNRNFAAHFVLQSSFPGDARICCRSHLSWGTKSNCKLVVCTCKLVPLKTNHPSPEVSISSCTVVQRRPAIAGTDGRDKTGLIGLPISVERIVLRINTVGTSLRTLVGGTKPGSALTIAVAQSCTPLLVAVTDLSSGIALGFPSEETFRRV